MQRSGSLFRRRRWRRALASLLCAACLASLCAARAAEMSCRARPDGAYLNQTSVSCAACPPHSRVPATANASSALACACEAGYANSSSACGPCALGRFKGTLGNATCSACPANTNTTAVARVALEECLCAPGFFFVSAVTDMSFVNVARACGENQDAACAATASEVHPQSRITHGNENNLNSLFEAGFGTSQRHFYRIDLQTSRDLIHIVFYNRLGGPQSVGRANGGKIHVGASATWAENAVCATLTAASVQTHDCAATGRYVFIVLPLGKQTLNFLEFQVFASVDNSVAATCTPCVAGSFKGDVGNEACAPCPVDTFCPEQSIAPVPCVGNSSRLQVGGQRVRDCLCQPGFFTADRIGRACSACPGGTFNALFNQTNCTACPVGTVNTQQAADDAAACVACGANAAAPAGSSDTAACACNLGFAGAPGAPCVACAAGKFRSDQAQYICAECPADSYNTEPAMVSVESCLACPAASSTTGRSGSGSQLDCVCGPGHRTDADDASARQCAQCGAGRFQPAHNATSCLACAAGTSSAALAVGSGDTCVGCAAGSFAAAVASGACQLCAADTWQDLRGSDAARQPCARCPRNASSVVTGSFNVSSCECAAGFWLADASFDASGAENAHVYGCVHCDAGRYCPGLGASLPCELNSWSGDWVNPGPCIACAANSFAVSAAGMRAANMCQCVAGAEGRADSNCSLCAAGSFQPCDFSARRAHAAGHNATCAARALAFDTVDAIDGAAATTTRCEACPTSD